MTTSSRAQTRARRRRRRLLVAGLGATALATGCHTATNELHPGREVLGAAAKDPLGKVLVDDEGRTMYLFEKDESHESYCTGACASVWPPVTTKSVPAVQAGVDASKVTIFRRDDGLLQVAYAGHPLYYYQADTDREDVYGQEKDQFGAEWYAVTPAGEKAQIGEKAQGGGDSNGS